MAFPYTMYENFAAATLGQFRDPITEQEFVGNPVFLLHGETPVGHIARRIFAGQADLVTLVLHVPDERCRYNRINVGDDVLKPAALFFVGNVGKRVVDFDDGLALDTGNPAESLILFGRVSGQ